MITRSSRVVVASLLGVGLLGGCTADDSEAPDAAAPPADVCSDDAATQDVGVDFTPTRQDSPKIDAALSVFHLGRAYCLDSFVWESPQGFRMTSYTVDAPANDRNYGQTFTTTDTEGSDELLNFPFEYELHGPCSEVTATIVMTDRDGAEHSYVAETTLGRGC